MSSGSNRGRLVPSVRRSIRRGVLRAWSPRRRRGTPRDRQLLHSVPDSRRGHRSGHLPADVHVRPGGRAYDREAQEDDVRGDAAAGDGLVRRGHEQRGRVVRQAVLGRRRRAGRDGHACRRDPSGTVHPGPRDRTVHVLHLEDDVGLRGLDTPGVGRGVLRGAGDERPGFAREEEDGGSDEDRHRGDLQHSHGGQPREGGGVPGALLRGAGTRGEGDEDQEQAARAGILVRPDNAVLRLRSESVLRRRVGGYGGPELSERDQSVGGVDLRVVDAGPGPSLRA